MSRRNVPAQQTKRHSAIREACTTLLYAAIIAAVLKCCIVDTRAIPTASMEPTIQINDRVIMFRLAYFGDRSPQRGDIVVFDPPTELGVDDDLIKRVIGLPGETLEIKNGLVYINGAALDEAYIAEPPDYVYGPVTVPEGNYFVMGDNRNHSGDSHAWLDPFLAEDAIKGKAVCRYWPVDRIGAL